MSLERDSFRSEPLIQSQMKLLRGSRLQIMLFNFHKQTYSAESKQEYDQLRIRADLKRRRLVRSAVRSRSESDPFATFVLTKQEPETGMWKTGAAPERNVQPFNC